MERIKLVIIDDGMDLTDFNRDRIIANYKVIKNEIKYMGNHGEEIKPYQKEFRHGTICESVLSYSALNYNLYCINIFDVEQEINLMDNLFISLRWCLDNKVDIIHMSIGTSNFSYFGKIEEIINLIIQQGIIIIAAGNNNDKLAYPACLPEVIGVRCSKKEILSPNEYIYNINPIDGIDIVACSPYDGRELKHYLNKDILLVSEISKCNSFTAPSITAKVCEFMNRGIKNIDDIKHELQIKADYVNKSMNNFTVQSEFYDKYEDNDEEIPVPNIVIYSEPDINIDKVIEALQTYFRDDKYNSVAISRSGQVCITKGIYVIKTKKVDKYIRDNVKAVYKLTDADILITQVYHVDEILFLEQKGLVDILIYCYENKVNKDIVNYYENLILLKSDGLSNSNSERIKLIYNQCINLFKY
ncbi:subtilase [Clostridium sporogenes]|nr:S8 family serine peptidase [Clostridium sporogenes]EJE7234762.1 S8 family serine peptidase [Clostridium botulinum]NFE79418.1 subtilase [Clostridium sporogenes]NFG66928.1 subtilase [Clostridium sporogenes]